MLCCYGAEKDQSLGKRIQKSFGKGKAINLALSDKGSWFDQEGFDNEGSESEESDEKGLEPNHQQIFTQKVYCILCPRFARNATAI